MNRKYIWLGICAAVILLSFLIPWIVLLAVEHNVMGQKEYLNVSGELVGYGELSIARKQQLMEGGELITSLDSAPDAQRQQGCIDGFREQIQILVDGGALPAFMTELARESYTVRSYLALHPQSSEAFRFYELSNGSNIRCYYDAEQQKILAVHMLNLTDIYVDYLLGMSPDSMEEAFSQQLRGWANYYGHISDEIYVELLEEIPAGPVQIVRSNFIEGEIRYKFGLRFEPDTESLFWGIYVSLQENLPEDFAE